MANYNWDKEAVLEMKGGQLDIILQYVNLEAKKAGGEKVNQFDRLDLMRGSLNALQEIFEAGIEKGIIVEKS